MQILVIYGLKVSKFSGSETLMPKHKNQSLGGPHCYFFNDLTTNANFNIKASSNAVLAKDMTSATSLYASKGEMSMAPLKNQDPEGVVRLYHFHVTS